MDEWSVRSQLVYQKSYSRPLNEEGTEFESWPQTVDRVIRHQGWLWERAKGMNLKNAEIEELHALRDLMLQRKVFVSGRSLWLGGTEISRTRESCNFNCSFLTVKTVFDLVDALWLLLQGCGVGFSPVSGVLNGFIRPIPDVELIRSTRTFKGGAERNTETWISDQKTWILQIGDSAESWAKAIGKLVAGKYPAKKLVLDLSQIRPAGQRLRGYGWISSGDEQIAKAFIGICHVLNRAAGRLLSALDILDIVNWMGTILSSRRSAELAMLPASHPHWREFALAKKEYYPNQIQRGQSNNSLIYFEKPSKSQLFEIFDLMLEGGGSEPGIVNGDAALRRAPYFAGLNPSLRADTRVLTRSGVFPIAELEGKSFEVKNLHGKWKPASCWLSGRQQPLWKVTLRGGHEIYATKEHQWPVLVEDRVVKTATDALQAGQRLPNLESDVLFDGSLGSYDEGFLVGWLFESGWGLVEWSVGPEDINYVEVGITVAAGDSDANPILRRAIKKLGSWELCSDADGATSHWWGTSHPDRLELLTKYGFCDSGSQRLPQVLFTEASEDFRCGFIDGLFSITQPVDVERGGFGFASRYRSIVRDLSDLLGFYGIQSQLSEFEKPDESGLNTVYVLTLETHAAVSRFLRLFRLSVARKQQLLEEAATMLSTPIRHHDDCQCVEIVSVQETELKEDVWDIRVEDDTHCFQLAHCVTGNCGEILLGDKGFCVHGDTYLITRDSLVKIRDVVDQIIEVWNGQNWSRVKPQITGDEQEMVRIELSDGSMLDCTPDHRLSVALRLDEKYFEEMPHNLMVAPATNPVYVEPFAPIRNESGTMVELAYELGFACGGDGVEEDGNVVIMLYGKKGELMLQGSSSPGDMPHAADVPCRKVVLEGCSMPQLDDVFAWNRESVLRFVAGLADSNGNQRKAGGIRIYHASEAFIRQLQLLLTKNGIASTVKVVVVEGNPSGFGWVKAVWYVNIVDCADIPCQQLDTRSGRQAVVGDRRQTIKRIVPLPGRYTSYCFAEPDTHKAVFNNMLTYQCNLCEVVLPRFNGDDDELRKAVPLLARANYRQTCVNLEDGILQRTWHELNEYLHLCGVGVTGVVQWCYQNDRRAWQQLKMMALQGANSMAEELNLPPPALVTTLKPSGTLSKLAECTEGIHKPLGKYIFNNINFSVHDPLVSMLQAAGYRVFENPNDSTGVLVTFPMCYENVEFSDVGGRQLNVESAVTQLERYRLLMTEYVQNNVSTTISYAPGEVGQIVDWMHRHWDDYVATAFIFRNDPTKTAEDLGHPYLPQEVVTESDYLAYVSRLRPVDTQTKASAFEIDMEECKSGMCPIK